MVKKALMVFLVIFCLVCPFSAFTQTYKKPIPNLPITLDPKNFVDVYSGLVISQIYDRLFDHDELLRLRKNLASEHKSDESGQIWTVSIRKDVRFHNGRPLTTKDIAFTIKRLLKGESLRYHQLSMIRGAKDYHDGKAAEVKGIEIIGPYELRITLDRPFPPFLSILASSNTEILPDNLAGKGEGGFFKNPIGTGPFKFSEIEQDKLIHLTGNEDYFGGKPYLKDIYYIKTSKEEAINGFNRGEYQDIERFYPTPDELKRSYRSIVSPTADTAVIVFNTSKPPLSNIHVRRALSMAINKEKLLEKCFPRMQPAKGYIPPGVLGYYPEMTDTPFDLNLARAEVKKSGLRKGALSAPMTLLRPDNHVCHDDFKRMIEESARSIGLNLTVNHVPMNKLMEEYGSGNYYMLSFHESADFPEALFMLNTFHSKNPDNFTKAKIPELDKFIDDVFMAADRYQRTELYRRIQEIIRDQALIMPIYYNVYNGVFQDNVRGIKINPLMTYLSLSSMKDVYFEDDNINTNSNK